MPVRHLPQQIVCNMHDAVTFMKYFMPYTRRHNVSCFSRLSLLCACKETQKDAVEINMNT